MPLRQVRLSLRSRPDSIRTTVVFPNLDSPDDDVGSPSETSRDVWDEAYIQLRTEPATAAVIADYEHVLGAALRPISPEHAHGLDRNPSGWISRLDEVSRRALIEALVTRGCEAFERYSYGRKMLSFVALSIDKMKSTIETMVETCPASSTAWLAACLLVAPTIISNVQKADLQPGINYVISRMPWYTELTKVPTVGSWKTPALQAAVTAKVVELYKLVIRYLLASARFYDHSTYRFEPNLAKWGNWEAMLAEIQAAETELLWCIHTHSGRSLKRALIEGARQGEHIKNITSVFSVAQRRANLMDRIMPDARLSHSDTYHDYVNQIANPHINTGHGVLSHPTFTTWSNADSGLLVLTGEPGTGKSVLAKYLLTELPDTLQQCSHLDDVEEKAEQATRHSVRPDSDLFWELVGIASRGTPHGRVTVVLDALDECKNAHLETALERLNRFQSRFPDSNVKFLLTTRPVPGLLERLTNGTILNLGEDAECRESIIGDIARVAQDRVECFARERCVRDEGTKSKLLRHLKVHDSASYLFADLLFAYLYSLPVRPGTNYWSRTVDHLPKSVIEIYRALLDQIPESNRDDVRIMLELVLATTKPLTVREMAIALALHIDDCTNCDREDDLGLPAEDFESWLRDTCGPFFDVYNNRIYFAHQTVRDYLLVEEPTQRPAWLEQLSIESCHKTMAHSCFAYQSLPFIRKNRFMSIEAYVQAPFYTRRQYHKWCRESFVFAEHAFAKWVVHVKNSHRSSDKAKGRVMEQAEGQTKGNGVLSQAEAGSDTTDEHDAHSEQSSQEHEDPLNETTGEKKEDKAEKEIEVDAAHDIKETGENAEAQAEEPIVEQPDQQTEESDDLRQTGAGSDKMDEEARQDAEQPLEEHEESLEGTTEENTEDNTEKEAKVDAAQGFKETGENAEGRPEGHVMEQAGDQKDEAPGQTKGRSAQVSDGRDERILIDQIKELFPEFRFKLALPLFCCSGTPSSVDVQTFVEMLPAKSPARDDLLTAVSQSLMARYCQLGDRADLNYCADLTEQVLKRTRRGHPQLTQRLATFDQGLNMRFWDAVHHDVPITGNEMREADQAVAVTPTGHPGRPAALHERAIVLERQYQRTKDAQAISQAIEDIFSVVQLVSPSSAKPRYLDYLANLLGQRFLDGGNPADLNLAVRAAVEAVVTTQSINPGDTKVVAMHRSTLAFWLGARYRMTRQPSDIDKALEVIRIALDITSADDPSLPIYLCSHARRLYERYEQTGAEEDLREAIAASRRSVQLMSTKHPLYPFHHLFHQVLSTEECN
ncbi:hypothetical protein P170DRAFT_463041 [Aspergillus steynii IBT 23096]|uniref:Uncharacterized protein n=1 Tax=Aspergillus steynii IBT 23096 TaxID=1392250 RepID=A0A2I2GKB5_9EURO|nr:uncharacterized protein P170DRAFT_463041 [Aspergillus steynii IBT 23096]PLB53299.1 hypothetical protein P170DRAFT_463041 [Aspergillus steynii IBT 23096]